MLYRIHLHSTQITIPSRYNIKADKRSPTKIFLDVALESHQITRRIFLGCADEAESEYSFDQEQMIYTDVPVVLELVSSMTDRTTESMLSTSPFVGERHLGRHTIFDLEHLARTRNKRIFTFASRHTPIYKLLYSVKRVKYRYTFTLSNITCLKQKKWTSPDTVYADVEFNYSSNNVNAQPKNRYWLGDFQQHESSSAFCNHHCTFLCVSPFRIEFFVQNFKMLNTRLDQWIFSIVKDDCNEEEDCIMWSHANGKSTEKISFTNDSKFTSTVNLFNEKRSYIFRFILEREEIPISSAPISSSSVEQQLMEKYDIIDSPYMGSTEENDEDTFTSDFLQKKVDEKGKTISQEASLENSQVDSTIPINISTFTTLSTDNEVEILIDGLQTFGRYYHYMSRAQESIDIIGWELSLSFGLLYLQKEEKWITLEDVLLSKAASGVRIRVMVWRHHILSYLTRFLYLGEVTIEREAQKLQKKASQMGLNVKIFHTEFNLPDSHSKYANPFEKWKDTNIIFVIVGNPKGMVSCHHEKLVLIDAELPNRCVAFIGGFDIARGRFDEPNHHPPSPLFDFSILSDHTWINLKKAGQQESFTEYVTSNFSQSIRQKAKNIAKSYGNSAVQPLLPNIRFLWHDQQAMIKGRATRLLHLHFVQRWVHAFTSDNYAVRKIQLPDFQQRGEPIDDYAGADIYKCTVRIQRAWPAVLSNMLLDNFCTLFRSAQEFIYMEHQYPFQNVALTQCMCETLKNKPNLKLIVINPVKTDLPSGIVGDIADMSQDHITDHLQTIYQTAPERVGIYGLIRQEEKSKTLKAVYIHSKFTIVDDKVMSIGSANLDNISFYKSSELQMNVYNENICKATRERLVFEHLGYYKQEMKNDFNMVFDAFRKDAEDSYNSLLTTGRIKGRLFPLTPLKTYRYISNAINYPNALSKIIFKLGINPHEVVKRVVNHMAGTTEKNDKSFFIQSKL